MSMVQTLGTLVTTEIAGKWVLIHWKYGNNRYCSIAISNFEVWTSPCQSHLGIVHKSSHHNDVILAASGKWSFGFDALSRSPSRLGPGNGNHPRVEGCFVGLSHWSKVLKRTLKACSIGDVKLISISIYMYLHNKKTMSSVTWVGQTNPTSIY